MKQPRHEADDLCPSSADVKTAWSYASTLLYILRSENSPAFMDPEDSLSCSQKPATGPYPEPGESSSHHHTLSLQGPFLFDLHLSLPSDLFPSGYLTHVLYAFSQLPYMLHALPISSSLTS
jgi:hypothetical protein